MWVVVLPIAGSALFAVINPAGPVHTVLTVTGTSTNGLSTTMQVRVTVANPTGRIASVRLLVTLTDARSGTIYKEQSLTAVHVHKSTYSVRLHFVEL